MVRKVSSLWKGFIEVKDKLDKIAEVVSKAFYDNGYGASPTVCPECHVDDFTHVEGCSFIGKELDIVIAKAIEEKFDVR